jgi:hypothetical protein
MSYRMFAAAVTAFALTLALCGPTRLLAADRFAVISIANETDATITMVYRWGSDADKRHTFKPKARQWFAFQYPKPDANASPDFHIKFDADSAQTKYEEKKKLHGFRAPDQSYDLGHKYAFRYNGPTKRFIEIYDLSK